MNASFGQVPVGFFTGLAGREEPANRRASVFFVGPTSFLFWSLEMDLRLV